MFYPFLSLTYIQDEDKFQSWVDQHRGNEMSYTASKDDDDLEALIMNEDFIAASQCLLDMDRSAERYPRDVAFVTGRVMMDTYSPALPDFNTCMRALCAINQAPDASPLFEIIDAFVWGMMESPEWQKHHVTITIGTSLPIRVS